MYFEKCLFEDKMENPYKFAEVSQSVKIVLVNGHLPWSVLSLIPFAEMDPVLNVGYLSLQCLNLYVSKSQATLICIVFCSFKFSSDSNGQNVGSFSNEAWTSVKMQPTFSCSRAF